MFSAPVLALLLHLHLLPHTSALEPRREEEREKEVEVERNSSWIGQEGESTTTEGPGGPPWYLLGLRGNTSLVHQRQADFLLFLRINVASMAGSEYEMVRVNSVSYTPTLLVNLSFTGGHDVSGLEKLSEQEDSLFLLSYVPFHVTSFTSGDEILVPRPVTNSLSPPREEEALLYLGVGAAVAFIASAALLVCVLLLMGARRGRRDKEPLIGQSSSFSGSSRYQDPPQTIYSENFSQDLARERERLHQFTPLDDSLCPITDTEVDFTPRYLREEDSSSWLSEGSNPVEVHSDPGCNGFLSSSSYRPGLPGLSEDGSLVGREEEERSSQPSRSPFYWQDSPPISPAPPPPAGRPPKRARTPPRPPSRTDSLNPNSRVKARPQSAAPRLRREGGRGGATTLPHRHPSRPLSVPAPHFTCRHTPSLPPTPSPSTPLPTKEEIDIDVSSILTSLDIPPTPEALPPTPSH